MIPLPDIDLPDIDFPDIGAAGKNAPAWSAKRPGFELEDSQAVRRMPASGRGRPLFDEDFDRPPRVEAPPEPEIIAPTFTLAEYEASREEAWRAGQAAERDAIRQAEETATRDALNAIAAQLDDARGETTRIAEESAEALARLLLDTLGALFPVLCARFGAAEAEGLVRAILPALRQEPRATVRLAPTLVRRITDTIERADPDLLPRVDIVADETLPPGDLRVTWRNGEARRDAVLLWTEIGDILGQAGWPTVPARIMEMTDVE